MASGFWCKHSPAWGEPDAYRIGWTCDHYYRNSMLRFPRSHSMYTTRKGAERFCKKHGLKFEPPARKEDAK